jgi:hypothetical protein
MYDQNVLALNGVGTSSCWDSLTDKANMYNFKLKKSDSGVGPSHHLIFLFTKYSCFTPVYWSA